MVEKSTIHLGFSFDKGYLSPFYVLLASIFNHNKEHSIGIHAIATGISDADKSSLDTYVKSNGGDISFYSIDPSLVEGFALPDHEGAHLTIATYYRLFFADLVPESVKKIIYIDIDTVVVGDLLPLYQTDNGDNPIAAVPDDWMPIRPELGITETGEYFNAGVTLIDIDLWKKKNVKERVVEVVYKHPERIKNFADQDALNMVLVGNWYKLDPKYNLTGIHCPNTTDRKILDSFLKDKVIIHFSGPKPWNILTECTHVYGYKWFQYQSLSPMRSNLKYLDIRFSPHFAKKLLYNKLLNFYLKTPMLGSVKRAILGHRP
ncbi:glycosyltransferase family 8 protein [Hymenobacter fodinae]|uniref:Glycosyltransferase family 8 protein n=1 Tax=Hymenobacter fodinae TaxID=2510796 RepID=A0A4Z0P949_9BACT|nr:glycosyltransferase family 8 protein [Hymenobacter fodinae]TGE07947.1 glycosyltransferase family 8 protein [Hymenobacter fodinae]